MAKLPAAGGLTGWTMVQRRLAHLASLGNQTRLPFTITHKDLTQQIEMDAIIK
jgi:hypothetical protein